jgi:hypothetical protein
MRAPGGRPEPDDTPERRDGTRERDGTPEPDDTPERRDASPAQPFGAPTEAGAVVRALRGELPVPRDAPSAQHGELPVLRDAPSAQHGELPVLRDAP